MERLEKLDKKKRDKYLLRDFRKLDLSSIPDVVRWIGKAYSCMNGDLFREVLFSLKEYGYSSFRELIVHFNRFKDLLKYNRDLEDIGSCLISKAMQDISEFGYISNITAYMAELYSEKIDEKLQYKKTIRVGFDNI